MLHDGEQLILNWTDPTGQLQWLQQQLQQATDAGKKVWLVGHIPLCTSISAASSLSSTELAGGVQCAHIRRRAGLIADAGCLLGYSTQVWQIIDKYSTTITAQFFGHTHEDSVRSEQHVRVRERV